MSEVLNQAAGRGFRIVETETGRIAQYETLYLDTDCRQMYLFHQAGRLVRKKVRTRKYPSGETFLEVKSKNNHSRTRKKRVTIQDSESWMDASGFISEKSGYSAEELSYALKTDFKRITLVNRELSERVTIDFGISFQDMRGSGCASLGRVIIIEVKQDGQKRSQMKDLLTGCRIHPMKISKYCIGTALTVADVKKNNLIVKLRTLNKLI